MFSSWYKNSPVFVLIKQFSSFEDSTNVEVNLRSLNICTKLSESRECVANSASNSVYQEVSTDKENLKLYVWASTQEIPIEDLRTAAIAIVHVGLTTTTVAAASKISEFSHFYSQK